MVRKSTSCITMDENVFILWITKNRSRYGCNDKDRFLDCQALSGLHTKAQIPYRKLPFLAQFHTISTLRGRPQGASQQEKHDVRHINSGNSAVSSAASPTACHFCADRTAGTDL